MFDVVARLDLIADGVAQILDNGNWSLLDQFDDQ